MFRFHALYITEDELQDIQSQQIFYYFLVQIWPSKTQSAFIVLLSQLFFAMITMWMSWVKKSLINSNLLHFSGLCPGCPAFYGNRAACHMMLGQFVQALEDARTSVQLEPNFVKGYIRVAKCCVALGEIHAARQVSQMKSNMVWVSALF